MLLFVGLQQREIEKHCYMYVDEEQQGLQCQSSGAYSERLLEQGWPCLHPSSPLVQNPCSQHSSEA